MTDAPPPAELPEQAIVPANYFDLYGLSRPPFGDRGRSEGYVLFPSHRRGFEAVIEHLVNGSGLLLVYAEAGIGKTAMLQAAAATVAESGLHSVIIDRPPGGRASLAQVIAAADHSPGVARRIILVDDADLLPPDCVQYLSGLLRPSAEPSSLAMVLTSATDLAAAGDRADVAALSRLARNTIRLLPIGPAEAGQYIERSLWRAGGTVRRLITPDALKQVILRASGVPGSINRLMDAAFTAGFARGDAIITTKTLASIAGPTGQKQRVETLRGGRAAFLAQGIAAGLLIGGAGAFLYRGMVPNAPHRTPAAATTQHIAPATGQAPAPPSVRGLAPGPRSDAGGRTDNRSASRAAEAVAGGIATRDDIANASESLGRPALSPELTAALMKRGEQTLALGDVAAARLLFQRAAEAGNAQAATEMGKTFDPDHVPPGPGANDKPDPTRAAEWYRKAASMGDSRAPELLKRLHPPADARKP